MHSFVNVKHISLSFLSLITFWLTFCLCLVCIYPTVYLLSHLPTSLWLLWVCRGRSAGWAWSYMEDSSLKWAMVIYQLLSFPWRSLGSACSLEIPQDFTLYICALFYISFTASLTVVILLWPLVLTSTDCLSDHSFDVNISVINCPPTTETLHAVPHVLLLYYLNITTAVTLFPFPFSRNLFCCLLSLSCQGGPDASRHSKAARVHTLCMHFRHSLPHWCHPDAIWRRVYPCWRLHRTGTTLWG